MQESRGCGIYKNEFMGEGIKENLYNYFCLNLTAIYLHFEWNIRRYKMLWDWLAEFHVNVLRLRNLGKEMHVRLRVSDLVIPVSLDGERN